MTRTLIAAIVLLFACTPVRKATYRLEESHNALYIQKALIVYNKSAKRVFLRNPTCTRCYFLKGRKFVDKWETGDTMVIDSNLVDFYNIHFTKCL
jgi:hypothetical protein